MKKSIAAIIVSGSLAISVFAASCGPPATQIAVNNAPGTSTDFESTSVGAATSTTDQVRLGQIQDSVRRVINDYIAVGQWSVPEYWLDTMQEIENAKQALRDLEIERSATQDLMDKLLMGGQSVPDYDYEYSVLQAIEQSRQEILKGIGLAD